MGHMLIQVSQELDCIEEIKSIVLNKVQQEYNKKHKIIENKKLLLLSAKKNNNMEVMKSLCRIRTIYLSTEKIIIVTIAMVSSLCHTHKRIWRIIAILLLIY